MDPSEALEAKESVIDLGSGAPRIERDAIDINMRPYGLMPDQRVTGPSGTGYIPKTAPKALGP